VKANTKFIETGERKVAHRSLGKGSPIIMVKHLRLIVK